MLCCYSYCSFSQTKLSVKFRHISTYNFSQDFLSFPSGAVSQIHSSHKSILRPIHPGLLNLYNYDVFAPLLIENYSIISLVSLSTKKSIEVTRNFLGRLSQSLAVKNLYFFVQYYQCMYVMGLLDNVLDFTYFAAVFRF